MQLSEHFSLNEFVLSQTASRKKIDNAPTPDAIENLKALCTHVLEPLRAATGKSIHISSGYRSPALNAAVGGAGTSQHRFGQAADFTIAGMSIKEVIAVVQKLELPFDQLLDEYNSWVHVSYSPRNRRQVLQIR